jgi:hypothetical protein
LSITRATKGRLVAAFLFAAFLRESVRRDLWIDVGEAGLSAWNWPILWLC